MKRVERIIMILLLLHGGLLIISQYLLLHTEIVWNWQPVHDYLGVFPSSEQTNFIDF
ncbi:hypothetical protein SAMN05421743_10692 [Thalassobacillus cyri]|uniref:Uncharacterized protein n=1 Tax=Thalassobacillus cyri TaxID=571932 RepID=A0A1H4CKP5_9BACI|nr:hypothetical protein SAMN05421743_10692 [Thalassobacillus cyri]